MAALDFPNNGITTGTIYIGNNNVVYVYDGIKWIGSSTEIINGSEFLNNIAEDTAPQLGGYLDLNGFGIVGTGTVVINGSIFADVNGSIFADDSTLLVDAVSGIVTGNIVSNTMTLNLQTATSEDFKINAITEGHVGPNTMVYTSRGTLNILENVQADDGIIGTKAFGYYNGNFNLSSVIRQKVAKRIPFVTQSPGAIELAVADGSGNFDFRKTLIMTSQGLGFGTGNSITNGFEFEVAGPSRFREGIKVVGTILGDLTGSVFTYTSTATTATTMLIDGNNGNLMSANINVVGSTANAPVDAVTVDSWLQISVNGLTKYLPLYV